MIKALRRSKKQRFDIVTIGSSLRDTSFFSNELQVIDNPINDATCKRLMAVEHGAKIHSDHVQVGFGGGAGNTAMNFAILDFNVGIMSSIGADVDGQAIIDHYRTQGIDTRFIEEVAGVRTGFSFITVHPNSHDRTMYVYYGAARKLQAPKTIFENFETEWFYISSLNHSTWKKTIEHAIETGASVAWNPGSMQLQGSTTALKQLMKQVQVLILNSDEAAELLVKCGYENREYSLEELVNAVYAFGSGIVLITDGANGSIVRRDDEVIFQPATDKLPLDTSGAGDCFGSSFVTGVIRYDGNLAKSLELGQYIADRLIAKPGAQNGFVPWEKLPKKFR